MTNPEINPYAAPQVGDGVQPFADIGVGVWRDGELLVMHRQAKLPPFCVITGAPTDLRCDVELAWNEDGKYWVQRIHVAVPLSESHHRIFRAKLWRANAAFHGSLALVLTLLAVCFASYLNGMADDFVAATALFSVVLLVVALVLMAVAESHRFSLLRFSHMRGTYLWLRGPDSRCLDRLPPWINPD